MTILGPLKKTVKKTANSKTIMQPQQQSRSLGKPKRKKKGATEDVLAEDLCPICDDVCTCNRQQPLQGQLPKIPTSRASLDHWTAAAFNLQQQQQPSVKKARVAASGPSNGSGQFIWDFNIRGQLIPLEQLGESDSPSGGSDSSGGFESTDAEYSDIVSAGDDEGDGLDSLSESASVSDADSRDIEMIYYEPSESSQAFQERSRNSSTEKLAAITPQILAAISTAAKSFPGSNTVSLLLVSTEDSAMEYSDCGSSIYEEALDLCSSSESGSNSTATSGVESCDEPGSDPETVNGAGRRGTAVAVNEGGDGDNRESDTDTLNSQQPSTSALGVPSMERWRRVPVNAFYRRSKAHLSFNVQQQGYSNALRLASADPTFIVTSTNPMADASHPLQQSSIAGPVEEKDTGMMALDTGPDSGYTVDLDEDYLFLYPVLSNV